MTDQPTPDTAQGADQGAAPSRIVLTFAAPGRSALSIALENVEPAQVYLAAWFLDTFARELRSGSLATPARGIVLADRLPPGGRRQ